MKNKLSVTEKWNEMTAPDITVKKTFRICYHLLTCFTTKVGEVSSVSTRRAKDYFMLFAIIITCCLLIRTHKRNMNVVSSVYESTLFKVNSKYAKCFKQINQKYSI